MPTECCATSPACLQATEIYYDPDPKTTIIEEDREWVEGYFDLNEVRRGAGGAPRWEAAPSWFQARLGPNQT